MSEGDLVIEVAKISTTLTRDKTEYLLTDQGQEIRMDLLKRITQLSPSSNMRINLLQKMEYNNWSNQKIATHLMNLKDCPDHALRRMSHIINAHDIWNRRILQLSQRFKIWQEWSCEECKELLSHVHQESGKILRRSQLDRIIHYSNTKIEPHESTVADIIYHVINHGTYHRGQISDILSSAGIEAIPTDFILFSRIHA